MRRRARTDGPHADIRTTLRALGWLVLDCSRFHDGWPDLVAVKRGRVVWIEVKDGALAPSRRALTPDEADFRATMTDAGGEYRVIESVVAAQWL